mmetsp:Transcript_9859/g.30426  ORF Transcript_9859/g.30426 Transcript_9859/m.30426 type:complete len:256 (-) Transcript_9859:58-825(-)
MNRKVYDVTAFHKRHPGGATVMLQMGGKDATEAAAAAHKNALPGNLMWEFCIGNIVRTKRRPSKGEELNLRVPEPESNKKPTPSAPSTGARREKPIAAEKAAAATEKASLPKATAAAAEKASAPKGEEPPLNAKSVQRQKRIDSVATLGAWTISDELQSNSDCGNDGAVHGSSRGSSRHDDFQAARERDLDGAPPGGKVAQLSNASTEVQPVGEQEQPPEQTFRELKATQFAFCSWPTVCGLLPLGLQQSLVCRA